MTKKRKQQPQETPEPEKIPVRDAVFGPKFLEDFTYWVDVDRKVALRLLKLVEAIVRDPFAGS